MQAATDVKFKVGDKAVYPAQGVAEVIRIEEKDIAGSRQKFYVLRILDTDRKILVPVANAGAVGLRQVISEMEIREIFDILRERTIAFDNQTWNRRYRGFMDKIKTGSIYDVAEVLRDLYRLKTDKQLSFGERRMLDTARSAHRERDRDRPAPDRGPGQHGDRGDLRRELSADPRSAATRRVPSGARRSFAPGASLRVLEDAEVPGLSGSRSPATESSTRRSSSAGALADDHAHRRRRGRHLPHARCDNALDAVDQLEGATKPGDSSGDIGSPLTTPGTRSRRPGECARLGRPRRARRGTARQACFPSDNGVALAVHPSRWGHDVRADPRCCLRRRASPSGQAAVRAASIRSPCLPARQPDGGTRGVSDGGGSDAATGAASDDGRRRGDDGGEPDGDTAFRRTQTPAPTPDGGDARGGRRDVDGGARRPERRQRATRRRTRRRRRMKRLAAVPVVARRCLVARCSACSLNPQPLPPGRTGGGARPTAARAAAADGPRHHGERQRQLGARALAAGGGGRRRSVASDASTEARYRRGAGNGRAAALGRGRRGRRATPTDGRHRGRQSTAAPATARLAD